MIDMTKSGARQCILIIDDAQIELHALCQILMPLYDIRIAKNGKSGLEKAAQYDIDLILLDVVMPDLSGFEVLELLKSSDKTKHIPVIFITGSTSTKDEEKALSLGAVDYIRKPFAPAIVTLRVRLHLQLIAQMQIIERFGLTDGLTGINNRRSFEQQLKSEWNRAIRNNTNLSMLMLDIDYFKKFNDRYGHLAGDACLKMVARVMQQTVKRGADFVFRWGGEEFAILLPETPLEGAIVVAEQIRTNIEKTVLEYGDETMTVTLSIGVHAATPTIDDFPEDFCELSDQALYKAKRNGRNRVEVL